MSTLTMGTIIQFPSVKKEEAPKLSVKKRYEVFACDNCGETEHFTLHCDGNVMCSKCKCFQPLTVFEPTERRV